MLWTRLLCVVAFAIGAGALGAQNVFIVTNTNDSGAGSLRQAILDANSTANQIVSMIAVPDEINFSSGTIGTVTLASSLPVITEAVSIRGSGRTTLTIDGGGTLRIFETSLGTAFGLSRMTLESGFATFAGAIYSRGATNIFDVVFSNCEGRGANSGAGNGGIGAGGAIYHEPLIALLTVTNCAFNNCQARGGNGTGASGGAGLGGAIFVETGSASLLQVTFNLCVAVGGTDAGAGNGGLAAGGAVYGEAAISAVDCVFTTCSATGGAGTTSLNGGTAQGGAVAATAGLSMQNCTLNFCTANGGIASGTGQGGNALGGGVAASVSGTAQLTLVLFNQCDASGGTNTGFDGSGQGAAVQASVALTMTECEATGCDATSGSLGTSSFGTVYHTGSAALVIQRSTIAGNNTAGIVSETSLTATITNCTISGNIGTVAGGIHLYNAVSTINFTTITLNSGTIAGGVVRSSGTLTIVGCVIAQNTTVGGTPDIDSNNSMTIQNSVVGVQDPDFITTAVNENSFGTTGLPLSAQLVALADNGGPTRTHALLSGSPAVNGGGTTGVPATDQRNAPRNVGEADAGSYEFGSDVPGGQSDAGGEGDERCSTGGGGLPWMALAALFALAMLAPRLRRARA
mgnify:CR=1 FL=1